MKGTGVEVAAIAILATVMVTGIVMANLVYRIKDVMMSSEESFILEAINRIELLKLSLTQSLLYSTYNSIYRYTNSADGSYDCISNKVYKEMISKSDYKEELDNLIMEEMSAYSEKLEMENTTIKFGKLKIEGDGGLKTILEISILFDSNLVDLEDKFDVKSKIEVC